jgi:molybdopterin synthase sulfur carrier subunit
MKQGDAGLCDEINVKVAPIIGAAGLPPAWSPREHQIEMSRGAFGQQVSREACAQCTNSDGSDLGKKEECLVTDGQQHNELTICYFSWIRENVGKESEQVSVPSHVTDIGSLIDWLVRNGGESYARAFENPAVTRAAINHCHVGPTASLRGAKEIAFFPPVTGG